MKKIIIIIAPLKSPHIEKIYRDCGDSFLFFSFRSGQRNSKVINALSWYQFLKIILLKQCNVLVIHYLSVNVLLGFIAKPFVNELVGVCWGTDLYGFASRNKTIWKFCASRFSTLAATSLNMCEYVKKQFNLEIEHRPFGLSPQFVDKNFNVKVISPIEYAKFITVKELRYKAGIDRSLRFLSELAAKYPNIKIKYDIYGSGPEIRNLKLMATVLETVNFAIDFKGEVTQAELVDIYPKYHFFICLSRMESLGLSFIEAAHFGLPPIISSAPGPTEIFGTKYKLRCKDEAQIETIIDQLYSVISDSTKYEELSNYSRDCTKPYLWKEWSSWYVKM
jgi:glycosyltransferase involved in cell wall biosynthesis